MSGPDAMTSTMSGATVAARVLSDLIDLQAATRPHAPALHDGQASLGYAALKTRVDSLAGRIAAAGPRQAIVAGCLERSIDLVVAFLGTMRAGAVWLPLDPAYPRARLEFMLQDAEPALLLASEAPPAWLSAGRPLLLTGGEGAQPVPPPPLPDELAYLIYTSGSTGRPKGVMVEHRGLVNLGRCQAELFGLAGDSRVLQVASPNFDAFVSEVAMTLWAGACLHLAPRADLMPGPGLAATLAARSITHVTLSPAALGVMRPSDLAPDLALLLAGEAWGEELLRRWGPGRRLCNGYGPTEATVCATMERCDPAEAGPPAIGRPLAGVEVLLLDEDGRETPPGGRGEILIGGIGVARGYWRRPDLTAERFVTDPAGRRGRFYRSGDLGRLRPDGRLDFHGRIDQQVKVRGHRIEPGEVEAALAGHPALAAAAVVPEAVADGARLVACVVPRGVAPTPMELRRFLLERLPDWMVPARWVLLPALPLSPSGKVDRRALPPPLERQRGESGRAPRDPLEQRLLAIWEDTLGLCGLGIDEDFFALGGDSLLAARLLDRVGRALGRHVAPAAMAREPTVAGLARALRAEGGALWSPLVTLSAGAPDAVPLFCVHPAGGTVLPYRALALALPPSRPFHGLQACGYEPGQAPDTSIEAMAARYAAAIEATGTTGPVALAGWSFGALVALETARLLASRGRTIRQVILLDAALGLDPNPEGEADIVQRLVRLYGWLQDREAASGGGGLDSLVEGAIAAGIFPAEFDVAQARRLAAITASCFRAGATYRPAPWDGPVTLLRASRAAVPLADPLLGWGAVAPVLVWTPGTHLSMMRQPDVAALAERIEALLEARPLEAFSQPGAD